MATFDLPRNYDFTQLDFENMVKCINFFTIEFKNYNVFELGFTDDRYFFLTIEENDISITCADGKTLEFVYVDPATNEELVNQDLNDLYNEIDLL
jgi:hypothetical protein